MINERTAFFEAIAASPDDDTPRLIYADWLEERGELHGEYIRLACTAAAEGSNFLSDDFKARVVTLHALRVQFQLPPHYETFHNLNWTWNRGLPAFIEPVGFYRATGIHATTVAGMRLPGYPYTFCYEFMNDGQIAILFDLNNEVETRRFRSDPGPSGNLRVGGRVVLSGSYTAVPYFNDPLGDQAIKLTWRANRRRWSTTGPRGKRVVEDNYPLIEGEAILKQNGMQIRQTVTYGQPLLLTKVFGHFQPLLGDGVIPRRSARLLDFGTRQDFLRMQDLLARLGEDIQRESSHAQPR